MISFDRVSVTYAGAAGPVLRDVSLRIDEGELCLVVGRTGAGKSTLLGAINGLVPHFTGGTLGGRVTTFIYQAQNTDAKSLADLVETPQQGFGQAGANPVRNIPRCLDPPFVRQIKPSV